MKTPFRKNAGVVKNLKTRPFFGGGGGSISVQKGLTWSPKFGAGGSKPPRCETGTLGVVQEAAHGPPLPPRGTGRRKTRRLLMDLEGFRPETNFPHEIFPAMPTVLEMGLVDVVKTTTLVSPRCHSDVRKWGFLQPKAKLRSLANS